MILGLLALSISWTLLSFFFPLTIYTEVFSLVLGYYFLYKTKAWEEGIILFKNKNWGLYFCILLVLFSSSFFPFILDYFGYYLPSVMWISQFGLVKGIANLDLTLGQMSFWHILQAGFSHISDLYLRINSWFLIIFILYIFEKKNWVLLLFVPLFLLFTQSPSPDLPMMVLSLIIITEILNKNNNFVYLFALSIWVFAIKPTVIWLPLFVFLYGLFYLKKPLRFVLLGSFILAIFIIKNLYCFGYPFFPTSFLDVGIPWKPNAEILKISSQYAIEKTFDMQYTHQQISELSFVQKVKLWFLLEGIKSKIHFLFVFCLVIFGVFVFIKKNKLLQLLWICLLIKSVIILLFSAQYRFFLEVFVVIFYVLFQNSISKKRAFIVFPLFSFLVLFLLSFPKILQTHLPSFKLGNYITGFSREQWLIPAYYEMNHYFTYQIGNLKFHVSKNYPFSFDTPLPAISPMFLQEYYDAGIFPQRNGGSLKEGFHWKKITESERKTLGEIIKNKEIIR
jgi:hypothetical protein